MNTRVFTTGVALDRGKLLILKRKPDDDTNPGLWDCVGGHFEQGESAEQCMSRETMEDCGQRMKIVKVGPLIEYLDVYGRSVAVPFILRPDKTKKIIISEHSEFKWIPLDQVRMFDIVPDLALALSAFGLTRKSTGARSQRRRGSS